MGCCSHGMCGRCAGIWKLVTALLLLLNAYIWPQWMGIDGWVKWVAVLMVLGAVLKLVKPVCPHCAGMYEEPAKKKR